MRQSSWIQIISMPFFRVLQIADRIFSSFCTTLFLDYRKFRLISTWHTQTVSGTLILTRLIHTYNLPVSFKKKIPLGTKYITQFQTEHFVTKHLLILAYASITSITIHHHQAQVLLILSCNQFALHCLLNMVFAQKWVTSTCKPRGPSGRNLSAVSVG